MKSLEHHPTCQATNPQEIKVTYEALMRAPKNLEGVRFVPWVGKSYRKNNLFNDKRLLILGESHYEWCALCWKKHIQRGKDLTCGCIAEHLIDGTNSISHWRIVEYALTGKILDEAERTYFWHSVAYYNFIQELVGYFGGGGRPPKATSQMRENSEQPFIEVIKILSPDIIIVLGYTLWNCLPHEDGTLKPITKNGKKMERCYYLLNDKKTIACRVRHPAAGLGSTWYPVISKAIEDI